MNVLGIKTPLVRSGESILDLLDHALGTLHEGDIVAITSKVVSICQQRLIPILDVTSKYALIQHHAQAILAESEACHGTHLTITCDRLIPSAGIDESNGDGHYVLYPEDLQVTTEALWHHLRKKHGIKNLGVIITDSHITPLRKGVTGTSLSWCGFEPLYDYIGQPDLFNKPLSLTQINLLDALATAAVLVMGEGNEQTPIARIQQAPKITFVDHIPTTAEHQNLKIALADDLFAPLLKSVAWI